MLKEYGIHILIALREPFGGNKNKDAGVDIRMGISVALIFLP